jgi:methionyl-tRNA formyltransferase
VAFRILPPAVYQKARLGAFNIHASLLPKYRGAAPINWAIINKEKTTGLTSFLLQEKVDTGDILLQQTVNIPENATAGDLHDILMPQAAALAVDTARLLASGDYTPMAQDDSAASPAPKLFREQCRINWQGHAMDVGHMINGVSPVPGAWTRLDGKTIKILRCEPCSCGRGEPGSFIIRKDSMIVNCGKGNIEVKQIQPEGKRPMQISDFARGWRGSAEGKFDEPE